MLGARGRLVRGVLAQLLQAWMQRCWVTLSNANRIVTLLVSYRPLAGSLNFCIVTQAIAGLATSQRTCL